MTIALSADELAILSTAIAAVQKDAERRRGFVFCADAKMRRFSKENAVDLIDRLATLAGHERGKMKREGLALAREVNA